MGIVRRILGPRSKYNKSLPYAYEARVDVLAGSSKEPMYNHYFSDTICGLIEYLDTNGIKPEEVQLFGVYRDAQIPLETEHCVSVDGIWLTRPELCHSLEEHYQKTLIERYKGHIGNDKCSFDDRNRDGIGPCW